MISLFLNHSSRNVIYIEDTIKASSGAIYEIQERINSGGNAVVHQCQQIITGEIFAIKIQLAINEKMSNRFTQEIQLVKSIEHEQLVKYIDTGTIIGLSGPNKKSRKNYTFLIMELAEKNLTDHLKKPDFNISYADYIGQFKGLALALAALHEKAIHRDIKPDNILINGNTWLLSDFGLCKYIDHDGPDISGPGEKIGPKYWMSPESLNRTVGNVDDISKQSDVFQLCSIYWYVVTGRIPAGIVSEEDWNGPPLLFEIIFHSLSHDPAKRPKDGKELHDLLEEMSLKEAL